MQMETTRNVRDFYVIGAELGSGTYATVYKGTHKQTNETVAVKTIKKKNITKFLEREIAIMQKVRHPNIVGFRELFEDEEFYYLVLDFIDGGDLLDMLKKRQTFSEEDASTVIRQILEAIQYLHSEGIVHRDIKLDNILCSLNGRELHVYLADFGLGRFFDKELQLESRVGSLCYAAPEIYFNKGYDARCDLWSIGVVSFILLAGGFPFYDPNPQKTVQKITSVSYDWEGCDDVSSEAKDFIGKLLVKDPKQRMTTALALEHPWITKSSSLNKNSRNGFLDKLQKFKQKFKNN